MAENKMNQLRVSILLPAWNEGSTITRAIDSFLSLKYPGPELIVVAGGEDETFEIAKKFEGGNIKVLLQEKKGKNRALNSALLTSRGDVIVLTDADCVMSDEWLISLLEEINEGEKAVSGGNMPLLEQLSDPFVLYQYSFSLVQPIKDGMSYLDGKNAAFRRELLEDLGGFDEDAMTGTDFSLKHRLAEKGIGVKFVAGSVIATEYPTGYSEYLRQQSRWLRNFMIYGRKYNDRRETMVFMEQTLIALLTFTLPLLTLLSSYFAILLTVMILLGIYNRVKIIMAAGKLRPELNFNHALIRIPLYLFIEYLSRILALIEYITPTRREKW
jgi:cellulose synthase/poly-beta-1,6-N-acetylglucosamine synthase-like glycosyltransferase